MQAILKYLRWIYASFYIAMGLLACAYLLDWVAKPDFRLSPERVLFHDALEATGFILPIMAGSFIVAGALMLFVRTAPLGMVILAPYIVVIFFSHALLGGFPLWGIIHTVLLLVFAWQFREAFKSLWNGSVS